MNVQGANAHIDPPSLCWRCVKITICDKEKCVVKYVDSVLNPDMKRVAKCNKFQAIIASTTELADLLGISLKKLTSMKEEDFDRVFAGYGIKCFPQEDPDTGITKYVVKLKKED